MNPLSAFPSEPHFDEFDGFWVELEHYEDQVPASDDLGDLGRRDRRATFSIQVHRRRDRGCAST